MEITAIAAALTSLKTAGDIAKLIKETGASLEKAEARLQLANLTEALADAKLEVNEIQQMLIDKDEVIRLLKEQLTLRERLQFESPYYWLTDGPSKEGPFCQCCYDGQEKLARLQGNGSGFWRCTICSNTYTDKDYQDSGPPTMFTLARGPDRLSGF